MSGGLDAVSKTTFTPARQARVATVRGPRPSRAQRLTTERPLGRARPAASARSPAQAGQPSDLLLREVHHRVKNNLQVMQSLLNLEASRARTPEVTRLVAVMQDRLRAIALVHDQLHRSPDVREADLRAYVTAVLDGIERSTGLESRGIRLRVRAAQGVVGMNDALRVGLVLNELVSNAASHGFPDGRRGDIVVSVSRRVPGRVRVHVSNTGVPLPARFSLPPDRLGLAIVANIARHSGGRFWWNRRSGASFHVELKQS
ncbi:MAG: sensor histidine kinase [Vicinamibacterales bacterium]